jgi:ABC-2 type transport system ATP-binding protein
VVPQELVFDPFFTVRETLTIQSGYFGLRDNRAWIDEVIENLDLGDKADTNMRALSGGMKRRVLVAQALVHKPPVIVLDEPTAGVDVELRQALWRFIRRLNRDGHTVVLTTHYLEEAEALCGRVAMLKQGRIVTLDTTDNLLRLHSGCYVELRLGGTLPAGLEPLVAQRREDGAIRLALPDYAEMERVMATLREAGITVHEMEIMQPDLEEVFVQIMRKS